MSEELWRPWESRGVLEREVAYLRETWRGQERRAEDGRDVPRTGETCPTHQENPGWTWRRRDGRGIAGMDVASPGWTWHCRDGRGIAGMDVASPGWTWHRRDGRGIAGMDVVSL